MSGSSILADEIAARLAERLGVVQTAERRLLNRQRAAEYLGCSETFLANLEASGIVRAVRFPVEGAQRSKPFYDVRDLDAVIESHKG